MAVGRWSAESALEWESVSESEWVSAWALVPEWVLEWE